MTNFFALTDSLKVKFYSMSAIMIYLYFLIH